METKKTELIGETREPKIISQEDFDALVKKTVYEPFKNVKAVSRCFCRKCGTPGEITKKYAAGLIRTMAFLGQYPEINLEDQRELRMHYFVTESCEVCYHKGDTVSVKMEKINFEV